MYHTPKTRWQLRLMNISFVVLFLLAMGLLQWLAREYHLQFDWTRMHRHSLAPASVAVTERLKEPLKITAFASQRGETRRFIQDLVGRYQKNKPDITLEFVDPDTAPERVRAAGVQFDGDLVFEYGNARESLSPAQFNEQNFTYALTRLGHRGERWVVFLSGHGERSPDKQANFDLSTWASQLRQRGFKTRTLSLGEHPQIPNNTTVLVIAGPRTRLLAGEVREIQNYLHRGGNLLWLHDPGPLLGLEPLAENLGVEFHPGVIVDPTSQTITGNAAAIVITKYSAHPVVRGFTDNTVFPHAAGISLKTPEGWQGSVLMDTRPTSWSETSPLDGPIQFDKGRDIRGPLNLAVALTRTLDNKREQRLIVVGDGDFLANTYLPNGGNLELGMSLTNWLSQDDAFVNIPVKTARDRSLELSRGAQATIAGVFLMLLPITLISSGVWIWLRRRKR
ncbi:MAG: GldG family protein [Sulfuricaulis sp.]|nr:GldG family protein [Sulfuricaulis sp.]